MALITGLGLFIVSILAAALSRTVAEEIEPWNPSIIRSLIKLAVGRLPESQRERFDEEWQSHVNEVPGKVGKFLVAAGFVIAAHNMALIDHRSHVFERLSRRLAQLDEAYSTVTLVVGRLQNDETLPLPLREEMTPLLNEISSRLNECREQRNAMAAIIAATPQTFVANFFYTLRGGAIRRDGDHLSLQAARIKEQGARLMRLTEERKRLGS